MITKEEWQEWKSLDATKEFIDSISDILSNHRMTLHNFHTFEEYKEACGYIQSLEEILRYFEEVTINE